MGKIKSRYRAQEYDNNYAANLQLIPSILKYLKTKLFINSNLQISHIGLSTDLTGLKSDRPRGKIPPIPVGQSGPG